nr:hypothetical protein [Tanacetum cinerariifolium]
MFHKKYIDYAELIWEDFLYQIDNRQLKKSRREIMPYPRFTKVIINHFLSIHSSVPKELLSNELAENLSLTESAEEEEAVRDTPGVSKKISPDLSQKLKCVQTLNPKEKLAADTIQAFKASRKSSRSQPDARGSSKETGTKPGVPNELTIILTTLSEGTVAKPRVLNEEKVTSKAKADVILDWD